MKFTSEDLMKAMGLQFGDKIKINNKDDIYVVELNEYCEPIYRELYTQIKFPLADLVNRNYEILPRPKRVGDLKCSDDDTLNCTKCPLFVFCHATREYDNKTLYDVLDKWLENSNDQEIYDLLKARLDKEVE